MLERVRRKAATFGQDITENGAPQGGAEGGCRARFGGTEGRAESGAARW